MLRGSGGRIPRPAVTEEGSHPDVFYGGPLLHELPTECVNWFEPKISCLVPSGWLRRWGHDGAITHADMLPPFRGKKWDVIVASDSEIGSLPEDQLFNLGEIICITEGGHGSRICKDGQWTKIAAAESNPIDFTGAGDIWATTFSISLSEGRDLEQAGVYASTAAAIAIESVGLGGCPSREQIEDRLR